MSWFKTELNIYQVNGSPLSGDDHANPYINTVTEEFVKVPLVPLPVAPTVSNTKVETHGSTSQSPDVSS